MIDHRQIDTAQISRKSNFPIEMYKISFLCILLFFILRYLRNEQNNSKNDIYSDIFDTLLFNKILKLNLIHFATLLRKLRFQMCRN